VKLTPKTIEAVARVSRAAGTRALAERQQLAGVRKKADRTFVTAADLLVDEVLSEHLPKIVDLPVCSEERNSAQLPRDCWLVDPIDGTAAFVAGIPTWSVSVALILEGRPAMGVVYFPAFDRLVHSGQGAEHRACQWEGEPDRESFALVPSNVHLGYSVSFPGKVRSLGSCSSQLLYVISGDAWFSLLGYVKYWDFAAFVPMLGPAGAEIFRLDGEALDMDLFLVDPKCRQAPLIAAPIGRRDAIRRWITERGS
jgi:fructose-1,6-bisphosphatase/inositol monophosphatase family enzyme